MANRLRGERRDNASLDIASADLGTVVGVWLRAVLGIAGEQVMRGCAVTGV